jgi:hypothetical protein
VENMKKAIIGVIVISVVIIGVSSGLAAYFLTNKISELQDFEIELGEWEVDRHVPMDPNNPGHEVSWSVTRVENASRAISGTHSLKLFIDGRQDDGVIWVEKSYQLKANTTYRVTIKFQFYCGMDSFNTITQVVGYCNTTNPEVEADLIEGLLGSGEQAPAWKEYSRTTKVTTKSDGIIWVAVGMSVVWESFITHFIDDLQIKIR